MNAKKAKNLISQNLWSDTNVKILALDTENIQQITMIVSKLGSHEDKEAFKEMALEELEKNPDAVIPSVIVSLCGRHPVDDSHIISVFENLYKQEMLDEAIFLGNIILEFNESAYVLRVMADCYKLQNKEEEKIRVWEKLIHSDRSETDVLYNLAEYHENKGEKQEAIDCYKRVILRHLNSTAPDLNSVKNAWPKIAQLLPDNWNYLIPLSEKISSAISAKSAFVFLHDAYVTGTYDLNSKIKILKKMLEFLPDNKETVEQLLILFREKYKDNPRLEYCLSNTGLAHNYVDTNTAIANFEKQILFVNSAFVYHNTWKLGRIISIEQDKVQIKFTSKKEIHTMSCAIAYSSLKILPKQHIWVLKEGAKPEDIRKHIMENNEWSLKMLLNSFNGEGSFKQFKSELVPDILSKEDWAIWQNQAKKTLSTNPFFSTADYSNEIFILRDTPISYEEKCYKLFSHEKGLINKYGILKDFLKHNGNTDTEEFVRMLNYFSTELKMKLSPSTEISSYLILENIGKYEGMDGLLDNVSFEEIYSRMDKNNIKEAYLFMNDSLQKSFIEHIIACDNNASDILLLLLHTSPSNYLLDKVRNSGRRKLFTDTLSDIIQHPESDSDLAIFLFKTIALKEWEKLNYTDEEILSSKLSLLGYVNGKIEHKVDSAQNRERQKYLTTTLFSNQELQNFLGTCDIPQARRILSLVNNSGMTEDEKVLGIKHFILSNRKDAEQILQESTEPVHPGRIIPKGFLCTRTMYVSKSAELDHIMNVEIPENSKEIGTARDLGDLRENAEYQYAKDKQKNLNFLMNKLTDEIDSAKIVEPEDVDTDYVEFGTEVTFSDNINNKEITYTLFGPWESNPEKNILNFQAPLGIKIYNMTCGENKKFEINGVKYDYTVKSIRLADFNSVKEG